MRCPDCNSTNTSFIKENCTYIINDEPIEIIDRFYRCSVCDLEWGSDNFDFAAELYRIYKQRHGWLQAEEIRALRKKKGITQKKLADLIGCDETFIYYYEKGALQTKEHEEKLRLVL